MIQIYDVTHIYNNGAVGLADVTIRIRPGEFVFLIGPSGAGKTTFLRLINHRIKPTRGHVLIKGKNLNKLSPNSIARLRQRIGFVFQDFKLLPDRNVYDNIAFVQRVIGLSEDKIRYRVFAVLSFVKLSHKIREMPHNLSGGEQQRIALARALVNGPDILLLDEPTGNLDPDISYELIKLVSDINRYRTTVVMVTHNKDIVNRFRKRVVTLREGRIIRDEGEGRYSLGP